MEIRDTRTVIEKSAYDVIVVGGGIAGIAAAVSASSDGWEVTRVIPVCALTGQAAGLAAAQAVRTESTFATLDVARLQESLKQAGVLFT